MVDFNEEKRIVSPDISADDIDESSLRPKRFSEYIGQEKIKNNLSIFIEAAKQRSEPLDQCRFTDRLTWKPPWLALLQVKWV